MVSGMRARTETSGPEASPSSPAEGSTKGSLAQRSARARFGLLTAALLVPLLVLLHAPLVAAIVPSAVLTYVSIHTLDQVERERPPALRVELVDPDDPIERERIRRAVAVPDNSRVVA